MKQEKNESSAYDPKLVEDSIYKEWEKSGYFNPDNLPVKKSAKPYVVYMPLPNVTGTLHMGHLLNNAIQDVVIRYRRMRGYKALYLPGTDHAGIATQFVVEKELRKQGINRFELGREAFIKKVWEWKEKYGGLILEQLRKIGVSADWSRIRFTMDEEYTKDVLDAFIHYHKRGLIYRGVRVVNWCPRCGTSLSELELEHKEEETKLWHIRYPGAGGGEGIIVATTRPETMLGDTAVAVNPKDARYKTLVGKMVMLPIQNRKIPVVADNAIDSSFGTGALKVTPAHDIVDFEIGERHKLPMIQVIDERGKMMEVAGKFAGMKADEARAAVLDELKKLGLLMKEEPYAHNLAVCYRCGHTIEPIPSEQWFLKMKELAKNAIDAVKNEKVKIGPENFEKTYLNWLSNIRDWTISRQIWWGHQLPVWFCKNDKEKFTVSIEKPKACPFCKTCEMEQVPDVLDTWFSSALWPFAGLSKEDVKKYYPGNALITARDILNLWVARMIYSGIEFQKKVPFKDVYIHGTVLTKEGKRMSKSLGTGIDPLKYINEFGADAARFAVIWQATGQDIHWDEAAVMAGRKFANKIWNAAKFVMSNHEGAETVKKPVGKTVADKKILAKLAATKKRAEKNIESFELSATLKELYDFFWHDLCDTYIEESKKQLADAETAESTKIVLSHVLVESIKMLHPFMPFVTEAIYQKLPVRGKKFLMIETW
ncbi:MAG: valine--tRNA ligase [Candidatus Jorgensenbacteria bacterium]|nr:valine--tRNA ligase [Candidatus Jorgensenbacteria bacterium]